ncbi:MAG: AEC family transporter [Pseudomonadota bacterium]
MLLVITALVPITLILALGKGISALQLLTPAGWIGVERLTYFVLFPALIVGKLAGADFSDLDFRMPVALIGAQVALGALSVLIAVVMKQPRDRLGVYVQSAVRWNTFIALALAQELTGGAGVALVVVAAAAMIPTANVLSVTGLLTFSNGQVELGRLAKQLAVNPLVIACALGLSLNFVQFEMPQSAVRTLDLLAQATIAAGLLTTGAAIEIKQRSAPIVSLLGWSLLRLFGLSAIAVLLAVSLGVSEAVLMAIVIATAVPTASNGTILARQLGADASLAANLIACQTILALLSIPFLLWFVGLIT